jgi:hypothetical protein
MYYKEIKKNDFAGKDLHIIHGKYTIRYYTNPGEKHGAPVDVEKFIPR